VEGERRGKENGRLHGALAEKRIKPKAEGEGFRVQTGDFGFGQLGHRGSLVGWMVTIFLRKSAQKE
jgi:hypothetical protein